MSDALAEAELPGSSLVLEITERILLVDSPVVLQRLDALKSLGVRIALDDFGTGYSSLAYLREFPIDILKIDRSFVIPLDEDPKAVALARAIIAIAEALDLDVIAEGTETTGQVQALAALWMLHDPGSLLRPARLGSQHHRTPNLDRPLRTARIKRFGSARHELEVSGRRCRNGSRRGLRETKCVSVATASSQSIFPIVGSTSPIGSRRWRPGPQL